MEYEWKRIYPRYLVSIYKLITTMNLIRLKFVGFYYVVPIS